MVLMRYIYNSKIAFYMFYMYMWICYASKIYT